MVTSAPDEHMLLQHDLVIHLVDVVARQNDHIFDPIRINDINVLRHGIGSAQIPFAFRHPLRRGQNIQIFVPFCPKEPPAALHVADQAVRLVLRRNRHLADAGVQRVRQGKVDDPRLAAKIDRRFGPQIRQLLQAAPRPPARTKAMACDESRALGFGCMSSSRDAALSPLSMCPVTLVSKIYRRQAAAM